VLRAQPKYPCELYIDGFGFLALSNNVNLNDTAKFVHSSNVYFRFVLFDPRGRSYFEIYKNNKLYAKGYYENSLDTLKDYASAVPIDGKPSKIEVVKYFRPLKNGEWVELVKGKYVKRRYDMGVIDKSN
jgi:hypothetical protein